jgi:hypothetical protein
VKTKFFENVSGARIKKSLNHLRPRTFFPYTVFVIALEQGV